MEDGHEGGCGSSSSSNSCNAQHISSSLSESIPISCISFLDSTGACLAHETSPCCIFNETSRTSMSNSKISTERGRILQAAWRYNAQIRYNIPFLLLLLRTVTQLPVSNTQKFYYQNIPFHLLNANTTNCTVRFQDL